MAEPVVTAAQVSTLLDTLKVVHYLCMSRQSPKIRTLAGTVLMSVDNIAEEEEDKMSSSSNTKIHTTAMLYTTYPARQEEGVQGSCRYFLCFVCFGEEWMVVW